MLRESVQAAVRASRRTGLMPIEVKIYQMTYGHRRSLELQKEFEALEKEVAALPLSTPTEALKAAMDRMELKFNQLMRMFDFAHSRAQSAAPYIHPKLNAIALEDESGDTANAARETFMRFVGALNSTVHNKLLEAKVVDAPVLQTEPAK